MSFGDCLDMEKQTISVSNVRVGVSAHFSILLDEVLDSAHD